MKGRIDSISTIMTWSEIERDKHEERWDITEEGEQEVAKEKK